MGAISYWYIKCKGSKICQGAPNIPNKHSSSAKAQDNIGWDNIMWVKIYFH